MSDVYNIPLYYISFKKNPEIENMYTSLGFKNVNHYPAIDGRKFDPKQLLEDNIITIRSFDDLMSGRQEHSGLSSLGAVGCTMSHAKLWEKCVENNWPAIIIAEEDNIMYGNVPENDILKAISKPNGIFLSTNISNQEHRKHFYGLHFYILSNGACNILAKNCFPIDVQTDWYMANLATLGKVNVEGYKISDQSRHTSSIQDECIKCLLPRKRPFYLIIIALILLGIIGTIIYRKKFDTCQKILSSISSSEN